MGLVQSCGRFKATFSGAISGDALRAKAMRGGVWLGTGSVAEQAVRFVRNMILVRILAPGAFGTMAIVLSSASLVDAFVDVGVRIAVIQSSEGGQKGYLNVAWWLGLARALLSYTIIFAAAPWIASFYARPELCPLLRVALLSVVLNGLLSPRSALAQREMKLGKWSAISNGGAICGVLLTIALSFVMRSVWALAIGYCCENGCRLVLSFILCPGWPAFSIDWTAAKKLLTFSRDMFGLAILNLIINRADIFVLGRLYPLAALGLYTMAVGLVMTPSSFLSNLLAQTLFPALSSIQNDDQRANRILTEVSSWLFLGMPAMVFVCLSAPSLLKVIYGSRYAAAAGPLSVACAVVFFTVGPSCVLFAKGLPAVHRHSVIATAAAMLIAVYPASRFFGPIGAQYAALFASLVGYVFQLVSLHKVTKLSFVRYGKAFIGPVMGSALMLILVVICRRLGLTTRPAIDTAVCAASGLAAYTLCIFARSWTSPRGSASGVSGPASLGFIDADREGVSR